MEGNPFRHKNIIKKEITTKAEIPDIKLSRIEKELEDNINAIKKALMLSILSFFE